MTVLNYTAEIADKVDELLLTNNVEVSKVRVNICVNIEETLPEEIAAQFTKLGVFVMQPKN
ncbi:hypothetical protein [Leptolyngbya phage Lbo-JY46]